MKTGITTSVILHAAVLTFGLFTLAAPRPYEVGDVEALPVDIVPVQSITQVQEGEKTAPKKERSAPKPTTKPDPVPDAQKVGENKVDLKPPPTPDARPKPVEKTAEAPPSPEPPPRPRSSTTRRAAWRTTLRSVGCGATPGTLRRRAVAHDRSRAPAGTVGKV